MPDPITEYFNPEIEFPYFAILIARNMIPSLQSARWAVVLVICLTPGHPAFNQEVLHQYKGLRVARFHPETNTYIRIYDEYYELSAPDGDSSTTYPAPGIGKLVGSFNFHLSKGVLHLVKEGSGPVYQIIDGAITRIDHSLDHNFQKKAIEFIHNDTLFRHGGYGFWEARNMISYFSQVTLEWEVLHPVQGPELPPGLFRHNALITDANLYVFSGYTINPYNRYEQVLNDQIWKFDFNRKQWTRLGTANSRLRDFVLVNPISYGLGRILFIKNQILLVDPEQNRIAVYPAHPALYKVLNGHLWEAFIHQGFLYYYSTSRRDDDESEKTWPPEVDYMRIPLHEITKAVPQTEPMYQAETGMGWWGYVAFAGMIGFVLVRFIKRKKDKKRPLARLVNQTLEFNGLSYPLQPLQASMLSMMLNSPGDLASAQIIELIGRPDLDYPNQVRIKNQNIRALNLELRSIFRTDQDLIEQTLSDEDRRIKCYRIDRSWFQTHP